MDGHGLATAWADLTVRTGRFDEAGEQTQKTLSEHSPRRAGTHFHIHRGLKLWQVQYIGRWGGATVEIYAGEAFARARSGWALAVARGRHQEVDDDSVGPALWEIQQQIKALEGQVFGASSLEGKVRALEENIPELLRQGLQERALSRHALGAQARTCLDNTTLLKSSLIVTGPVIHYMRIWHTF